MLAYVCDWCKCPRNEPQRWILGFAAERVGIGGVQREISIASAWSDRLAEHPLAVHFCSEEHKQAYIHALFDQPASQEAGRRASLDEDPQAVFLVAERPSRTRRPRHARRPSITFTAADEIHSRGLGVRLDDAGDASSSAGTE